MKKVKLLVAIRSHDELEKETLSAFKKAEIGMPGEDPIHRLYFANQSLLFSALSPKRWELMKFLRQHGPMSTKKLASELKRDYKNVYDDVQQLCKLELIQKNDTETIHVPWDDITIEMALAA